MHNPTMLDPIIVANDPVLGRVEFRDRKRALWALAVAYPLMPFVGIAGHHATGHALWLLLPLLTGYVGGPLLDASVMAVGRYRLLFEVAAYFRARGVVLPEPAFVDVVPIDFGISDAQGHYHVPLLVTPWTYSTYRGS